MRFHFAVDTVASPEQVLEAFTDFTDRRLETWEKSLDPEKYEVREIGDTWAIVREGSASPSVWAVERYDWSTPGEVRWAALESNFCEPGSGMELVITPGTGGGSHLEADWHREPAGLRGALLLPLVRVAGPRLIPKSWVEALDRFAGNAG